jgi:hypothetical protein
MVLTKDLALEARTVPLQSLPNVGQGYGDVSIVSGLPMSTPTPRLYYFLAFRVEHPLAAEQFIQQFQPTRKIENQFDTLVNCQVRFNLENYRELIHNHLE